MKAHILAVLQGVFAPQHQVPAVGETQLQSLLQHHKVAFCHKNRTPELSGREEAKGFGAQSFFDQRDRLICLCLKVLLNPLQDVLWNGHEHILR